MQFVNPMHQKTIRFCLCAILWYVCTVPSVSQYRRPSDVPMHHKKQESASGILFLHLQFIHDSVCLVDAKVMPGKLKTQHSHETGGGIKCEIQTNTGQIIDALLIDDPLQRRVEYPLDEYGAIGNSVMQEKLAHVWIRFPYRPDIARIACYRIQDAGQTSLPLPSYRSIGIFNLILRKEE